MTTYATGQDKWAVEVSGTPNQCHNLFTTVVAIHSMLASSNVDKEAFAQLISKNQNPYCGGDGTMSLEQWYAARDVKDLLESLGVACQRFIKAPLDPQLKVSGVLPSKIPVDVSAAVFADEDIPF